MCDFVHLHVHSEYSLLDGLGRTKDLAKEAVRLGQKALALTDHGVMHGAVEFYRNCKKQGIKPVIGVEAYMTPHGRRMVDRHPHIDKKPHHLLLLAQNMTGYKNLLKICSDAQLKGYYYKPRIDADYLAAHADGLICTTGCMAAEIPWLLNGSEDRIPQPDKALERLQWYLDVFGRERFFIELQEHSIPALTEVNKTLFDWSKSHQLELLVTNDVHYVTAGDAPAHDTLLCVQTNSVKNQQKRMRLSDSGYYLKSETEMRDLFRPLVDLPDSAFTNSVKIADMCDVDLEDDSFHLPDLPPGKMPAGFTYETFLRHLTDEGLKIRYGSRADSPEVQARKEHELSIINRMGFSIYYLIVWDLCEYARGRNIWWNVRGSGAGSIVAYAVGITLIDPLKNNLIFERFLNPGRISMPDFDLDYPDDQREELIRYTVDTYGSDRVAQIVSFGRMKARAAIRDVGRAMDVPLSEVDVLARQITAIPGKPVTIDNALDKEHEFYSEELRNQYEQIDHVRELIDYARNLEGVARHSSIHAAAVIITDKPLVEYVPLMRAPRLGDGEKTETEKSIAVTQFEFPICESIGLLKVDFLGLSTLTVMRKAAELIEQRHGVKYHLENIRVDEPDWQPLDPNLPPDHLKKAFQLLSGGNTSGVFQVEGQGMTNMLREMKPTSFEHIVAAISLYRPGPMEYIPTYIRRLHGEEEISFKHDRLKNILGETYGIIVYQEQIIQIASDLAGYSPGDADQIRKAVGKKIKAKIDEHHSKFIDGAEKHGVPRETSEAIWGDIEFFARYGFNKCLPGDVEVLDAVNGQLIPIEDLYHGRQKIKQTVTCDVGDLSLKAGTVVDVLDNGIKPVYRLTTNLGHEIEATSNHPFYSFGGWRQLDELRVGERIAVPRRLPIETDYEWPDYQVIVLGHLLAEGNLCHPHSVYYYTQSQVDLDDYIRAVEQFPNVICTTSLHKDTHSVYAKRLQRDNEPGVVTWAKDLGIWGKTATQKEIPAPVFSLSQRQIALLLGRMWSGDGHVGVQSSPRNYIHAYYATSSKRMAQQVQHLLLRLGVVSRLREVEFAYKEGRIGYQVHVMGSEHSKRFAETVGLHLLTAEHQILCQTILKSSAVTNAGTRDTIPLGVKELVRQEKVTAGLTWTQFRAETGVASREFSPTHNTNKRGFRRETISTLANYFDSDHLRRYAENDIYWDEVVSIEYVGLKQTYDLTISDTHNFVANNIIVHNSHAADYGMVTCQTAYLKANYPIEYMTALLTVERNNTDKVSMLLGECRMMGIRVLPPDVNHSQIDFIIDDEMDEQPVIRFGMSAIKNVGEGPIEVILKVRDVEGKFIDIDDFCNRVNLRQVNRRALEGLIKVGAMDCFTKNRALLLAIIDRMLNLSSSTHKAASAGQRSLFDVGGIVEAQTGSVLDSPPQVEEISRREILDWEKELVGTYLSEHPVQKNLERLKAANITMLNDIDEKLNQRQVSVAGVITSVRQHRTKKGDPMAFVEIEDMQTSRELVVFPRTYTASLDDLVEGNLVIVRGKVDASGRTPKILADNISTKLPDITEAKDSLPNQNRSNNMGNVTMIAENSMPYDAMDNGTQFYMEEENPFLNQPPIMNENPFYGETSYTKVVEPAKIEQVIKPVNRTIEPIEIISTVNGAEKPGVNGNNKNGVKKPAINDVPMNKTPTIFNEISSTEDNPPIWLGIRIPYTEKLVDDKHRLKMVFEFLVKKQGKDRFRFHIHSDKQKEVIDFPNHTTKYSDDLRKQLVGILGPENVWLE
jgi:DNA polymerase-3 subunit alpha